MTALATGPLARPASSRALRAGAAIALVLGLVDLVGVAVWANAPAPLAVSLISVALGAVTLVGATVAWDGARWGVWAVLTTRILSALMLVPAYLVPEAPKDPAAVTVSAVQLALTVACVAFLAPALRRPVSAR